MNSVVERLGPRVRQFRLERGLTLDQVSEATGMGLEMLKKIERGVMPPSFTNFVALAETFRVDPFYLLIFPDTNPLHDLVEATRGAPKATVVAMRASCEGLLAGLARSRREAGR